jgi:predicted RNA-binding protein
VTYWLDVFTLKSFDEFQKAGANVSGFPERRWKTIQRIRVGDILLCYMKTKSCWFGALEVASKAFQDNTPIWSDAVYPCRIKVRPLVFVEPDEAVQARNMLPRLKLFANLRDPERWSGALRTSPRVLAKEDGDLIVGELNNLSSSVAQLRISSEKHRSVTHKQLVEMLRDLGRTLGFIAKTEEETPDKAYRCDVTWRDYEGHAPLKVFEVELSRNIEHALSSLLHASHSWRPEQLYLIVADEIDSARVDRLIQPKLYGAFSDISRRLRAYPWSELKKLHDNLSVSKEFLAQLAER